MRAWGLVVAAVLVAGQGAVEAKAAANGGGQQPTTLTLQVVGPSHLERFLVERMRETWDLQLTQLASDAEALGEAGTRPDGVWVAVQANADDLWTAKVGLGPELLTLRSFEVREPTEATLTLWLLLKSTIDRALKQLPSTPPSTGAEPRPPTPISESAHVASPPPATPPTAPASSAGPFAQPRSRPEVGAAPAPPGPPRDAEGLSLGVVATAYLEVPRLPAAGAAMRLAYTWSFLHAMAEIGYRYAPGPQGLQLHALPLLVAVAAELGDVVRLGVGPLAAAELKIPVSSSGAAVDGGAELGGFALARVFFRSGLEISMRFAVVWRLARLRILYRDVDGAERQLREKAYTSTLSMGVMWP